MSGRKFDNNICLKFQLFRIKNFYAEFLRLFCKFYLCTQHKLDSVYDDFYLISYKRVFILITFALLLLYEKRKKNFLESVYF